MEDDDTPPLLVSANSSDGVDLGSESLKMAKVPITIITGRSVGSYSKTGVSYLFPNFLSWCHSVRVETH